MKSQRLAGAGVALAMLLTGCVTGRPSIGTDFRANSESASVLIMEPDVQVTFVTTSGPEKRADWSEQAKQNLVTALTTELKGSGEQVVVFQPAGDRQEENQQALLLNQAVTDALAAHKMFLDINTFMGPLPHQANRPELYTMGDALKALAQGTEADYAVFLTARSYVESAGMFWTKVMIGTLTGYVPASAQFRGTYVSVADLKTGEITWLKGVNLGDIRNPQEAANAIAEIFKNGPFSSTAVRTASR